MHRAEQIIQAIVALLTAAIATRGWDNVYRGRTYFLEESMLPALEIRMGDDRPVADNSFSNMNYIDGNLVVHIDIIVQSVTSQLDTLLNDIRKEIHIELMGDEKQGLDFLYMTIPLGADEPVLLGDGEKPVGRMTVDWVFRYRSSATDPSA